MGQSVRKRTAGAWVCALWIVMCCASPAHAQQAIGVSSPDSDRAASIGLQTLFQRDGSGGGFSSPDVLFGAYLHVPHSNRLATEWSASIGTLSGRSFKSRRVPLEGRVLLALGRSGFTTSSSATPFLYSGVGWLFHRPIEVPTPNDPLLGDMGPAVGSSSLWQYESGATPYIPLGVGATTSLSREAWLDARFGYHIPLRVDVLSSGAQIERGFWGFTLAIRFRSADSAPTIQRPPHPGRTVGPFTALSVPPARSTLFAAPVDTGIRERISDVRLLFDINSSELGEEQRSTLDQVVTLLAEDREAGVLVSGHTDPLGGDLVNEFLSWNRARAVWLYLIDQGVSQDRLRYRGYRDQVRSAQDAELDRVFPPDRRVEFHAESTTDLPDTGSDLPVRPDRDLSITGVAPGTPLFGVNELPFDYFSTQPKAMTLQRLTAIRDLLIQRPHYNLSIVAKDDSYDWPVYRREVSKGRAEWVRAWLIDQGVEPDRLKAYGQRDQPGLPDRVQNRLQGSGQQMLLLPWLEEEAGDWP
ncbi:MAG: OmpA family protein [Bacteroidota bacterium]